MWAAILSMLPTVLQIAGWFIQRSQLSKKQKQDFFEWVKLAGKDLGSVKLHKYGQKQVKFLQETPFKET